MHTLEVTDRQLTMLHESLNTWIKSFSHDQPDLLRAGKELRAKLDEELAHPSTDMDLDIGNPRTQVDM